MDIELRRQVDNKFYLLALYQQGEISYFKIVVDTVFKMSGMAEESLKSFIKEFGNKGLAKIPNENVRLISFQVDGVAERLADSNLLHSESFIQYVKGLTVCLVPVFRNIFFNKSTRYMYQDATGTSPLSSMTSNEVLGKIKETSSVAVSIYDSLNLGKQWNLPVGLAGVARTNHS